MTDEWATHVCLDHKSFELPIRNHGCGISLSYNQYVMRMYDWGFHRGSTSEPPLTYNDIREVTTGRTVVLRCNISSEF